jgi:flagellum-specific peptidoglycan hydrolase FlgJ
MKTIIYEKTLGMLGSLKGFFQIVFERVKAYLTWILLFVLIFEPKTEQNGQIVLTLPTFSKHKQSSIEQQQTVSTFGFGGNLANMLPKEAPQQSVAHVDKKVQKNKLKASTVTIADWINLVSSKGLQVGELEKFEYLKQYAQVLVDEMRIHQIPASITIAQALLESNAGRSNLALKHKNHFGIKCYDQVNAQNACVAFYSDGPADRFKHYDSVWSCFRDHSYFLKRERYADLFELDIKNYEGWAKGLKQAGYATDAGYAEKLVGLIERWDLNMLDYVE